MPPKVKFTKDEIVSAAVNVVRESGINALTTRRIAAVLGVSTRPIFTYFNNMDEVCEEVVQKSKEIYAAYIEAGLAEEKPFFGFGKQYVRFAADEPELYRLLFLTPRRDMKNVEGAEIDMVVSSRQRARESICRFYHVTEKQADLFFMSMWLVAHSIATLSVTDMYHFSVEETEKLFIRFSLSICKAMKEIPDFTEKTLDSDKIFKMLIMGEAVDGKDY